ncbi:MULTISPECIES: hypothetical protein [unclassified Microcoleus]|nr:MULTISPECIES: hypothetical protein [unclassified Microcoleus]
MKNRPGNWALRIELVIGNWQVASRLRGTNLANQTLQKATKVAIWQ